MGDNDAIVEGTKTPKMINSLLEYLDYLFETKDKTVVICIKDTAGYWLNDAVQSKLAALGLKESLVKKFMVGYIAILRNGRVMYENSPKEPSAQILTEFGGHKYKIESRSFKSGNLASIIIDGKECAINSRGLNIVVFDEKNSSVVDSVAFDTHVSQFTCVREAIKHYDVCLVGFWYAVNYGSQLNGYATYRLLTGFGKKVLMLQKPNAPQNDPEITQGQNTNFVRKYYDSESISPSLPYERLSELNDICDCFCAGSDQIWNYNLSFRERMYLSFASEQKKLISFATSFGHAKDKTPAESKERVRKYLQRFHAISVREQFDVDILKNNYGVQSELVFEPVFCIDKSIYEELAATSSFNETEPYLLTYILNPTAEKRDAILYYQQQLGIKVINIHDGDMRRLQKNNELFKPLEFAENIGAEDFIKAFMNAQAVITDSFHGSAFSIIFQKPFFAIGNYERGFERFQDLLGRLNLLDRLITDSKNIPRDMKYLSPINYEPINAIIHKEAEKTLSWLKKALESPFEPMNDTKKSSNAVKEISVVPKVQLNKDTYRCQMIAALLRDYGIRHIVLSSGTRHVQLVKFFEQNDCFITHNVVDERSAAFFALGLSVKLKEPVVVCCTSGTALSNYSSAMSEAYYQHVPLIFISADRYPYLLNQREDQMVPQSVMFKELCLKSTSLMPVEGSEGNAVARRMICETILEATHSTYGPVHINVPIAMNATVSYPLSAYKLDDVKYTPIYRYKYLPHNRDKWKYVISRLKSSKSILIIYGQNHSLTAAEQEVIDTFCENFNCVICTDNLSNVKCSKSVNIYNMMKKVNSSREIINELHPEIVITMYGNNVGDIKWFVKQSKNYEHWDISESGIIADPFKKIKRVFECSPVDFLKRANYMVSSENVSDSYYKKWMKYYVPEGIIPNQYSQRYAMYNVLKKIPANSLLHLANSNTVRFGCAYKLNDGIEVYCNRGTNGIDGSASSFMGQASVSDELCFLLIGDLSFFYDMNSLWNKNLKGNIRIMLLNNSGAALLKFHNSQAITYKHDTTAKGWVESLGFKYLSSKSKEEYDKNIDIFTSKDEDTPMFFEVFC